MKKKSISGLLAVYFLCIGGALSAINEGADLKLRFRDGMVQFFSHNFHMALDQAISKGQLPSTVPDQLASGMSNCTIDSLGQYSEVVTAKIWQTYANTESVPETLSSFGEVLELAEVAGSKHIDGTRTGMSIFSVSMKDCLSKQSEKYPEASLLFNQLAVGIYLGSEKGMGDDEIDSQAAQSKLLELCNDPNYGADCNNMGYRYQYGEGVKQDYALAAQLYQKACDVGVAIGCNNIGNFYRVGHGVSREYSKAVVLFQKACDGGDLGGCTNLGWMYDRAEGVQQDFVKAVELYTKVCDLNGAEGEGCNNLADKYRKGEGVKQDYVKATALFERACEGGASHGCNGMAEGYYKGQGVKKDLIKAADGYRRACEGGHNKGCYNLGMMYYKGEGVEQKNDEAIRYLSMACNMKFQGACESYEQIKSEQK